MPELLREIEHDVQGKAVLRANSAASNSENALQSPWGEITARVWERVAEFGTRITSVTFPDVTAHITMEPKA